MIISAIVSSRVPRPPGDDVAILGQLGQQAGALGQGGGAGEDDLLGGWGMLGFSLAPLTLGSRGLHPLLLWVFGAVWVAAVVDRVNAAAEFLSVRIQRIQGFIDLVLLTIYSGMYSSI
jgi:hypothetical protein